MKNDLKSWIVKFAIVVALLMMIVCASPLSAQETNGSVNVMPVNVRGVKFNMRFVPSGSFVMGKGDNTLAVELTQSYYLAETEVTIALWNAVMRDNLDYLNRPIEVRWLQIPDFLRRLNNLTGMNFRLPTEAEWEYAARYHNGNMRFSGSDNIIDTWNSVGNRSKPNALNKPNKLGIYGMSNGIAEWCNDIYQAKFPSTPQRDYQGPTSCDDRCGGHCKVVRGYGDFNNENLSEVTVRSVYKDTPLLNGFRLCLTHKDVRDTPVPQPGGYKKQPVRLPAGLTGIMHGRKNFATGTYELFLSKERFPVEAIDNKIGYGFLVSNDLQGCPKEFFLVTKIVPAGTNAVNLTMVSDTSGKTLTMKLSCSSNTSIITVTSSDQLYHRMPLSKKR